MATAGKFPVKLYVYDLSRGLARSISPSFIGLQIDGIWHTGIVAYGKEFFYGGTSGIAMCPPSGTILGNPDEVVDLGMTEIPQEVFMEFLHELSASTFRAECYHLFHHNCNTFSNEASQFLTGRTIPAHITNLPQDVLNTPFGSMIQPFIDAMHVQGGHALFPNESASPSHPQKDL